MPAEPKAHVEASAQSEALLRAAKTRSYLRMALAWLVGLGLLVFISRKVRWGDLSLSVTPPPWWAWALSALGIAASYLFRGLRIHSELSRRHPVTRGQCLRVMLLHNTAVNVLPMRGGEAAYPILVNRQLKVPLGQAVASLVWIRAQDMLLLSLAVVAFLPWVPPWARCSSSSSASERSSPSSPSCNGRRPPGGGEGSAQQALPDRPLRAPGPLRRPPPRPLRLIYGGGSWAVKLLSLGFLLSHLGRLRFVDGVAGALGGELAGILPIQGPAGFGTYEAGVWAGASIYGRSVLPVAAPAVALHLFSLATAVVAGAVAYALSPRQEGGSEGDLLWQVRTLSPQRIPASP